MRHARVVLLVFLLLASLALAQPYRVIGTADVEVDGLPMRFHAYVDLADDGASAAWEDTGGVWNVFAILIEPNIEVEDVPAAGFAMLVVSLHLDAAGVPGGSHDAELTYVPAGGGFLGPNYQARDGAVGVTLTVMERDGDTLRLEGTLEAELGYVASFDQEEPDAERTVTVRGTFAFGELVRAEE